MSVFSRRSFLGALVAAPAVIRTPGLLMPVRTFLFPPEEDHRIVVARSYLLALDRNIAAGAKVVSYRDRSSRLMAIAFPDVKTMVDLRALYASARIDEAA